MTPIVHTVDETATLLRCSRAQVFRLLAAGTLTRAVSYGRKTLITAESVRSALEVPVEVTRAPRRRQSARGFDEKLAAILERSRE